MTTIETWQVRFDSARIDALRERLDRSSLGYAPDDDADWKYGADAAYLAEFRAYWLKHYDFAAAEKRFNRFPQFRTVIDGIALHFYHVRASGGGGFPLLLTYGWPGSVVEFHAVIQPVTKAASISSFHRFPVSDSRGVRRGRSVRAPSPECGGF